MSASRLTFFQLLNAAFCPLSVRFSTAFCVLSHPSLRARAPQYSQETLCCTCTLYWNCLQIFLSRLELSEDRNWGLLLVVLAILIVLLCCAVFTIFTEARCCRMSRACAFQCLKSNTYLENIYTSVQLEFEFEVTVVWKDVADAEAGLGLRHSPWRPAGGCASMLSSYNSPRINKAWT